MRIAAKILRPIILWIYQLYLIPKKIILSALKPATDKFKYLLSNRYIAHFLIIVIVFFTLSGNLAASETITEGIQSNIFLKQIITDQDEYVQEEIIIFKKPSITSYLQEGDLLPLERYRNEVELDDLSRSTIALNGTMLLKPTLSTDDAENFTTSLNPNKTIRTDIITYIVKKGDTVSTIAARYGIDTNTILWENNLGPRDYIRPGDELTILPINGIRHTVKSGENLSVIAQKYDVEVELIEKANKLTSTSIIRKGDKLLIPDAAPTFSARTKKSSTIQRIKDIFIPAPAKIPAGSQMIWPTIGHRINQYFSWRHPGIDIDGISTNPIYAADSGTVIKIGTGWSGGYGNHIRIDHGNGLITLYAHLSRINVSLGQKVNKGDVIGIMGTTGRSTGVHLHFEVRNTKGNRFNPFNYVK